MNNEDNVIDMKPKKKKMMWLPIGVALVVLLLVVLSSMVITYENEYTLIKKFGKVERIISNEGLSFRIPFVESKETLPKTTLLYDLEPSDVITKDKKTMVADSYVLWKIEDPLKFAQTLNASLGSAEGRINTVAYNSIKNIISSLNQEEVISGRDGTLSNIIMENIGDSMEGYGIKLMAIETKQLDLPGDNKDAVYARMISERDKMAATDTAEGKSEAQKICNETDKQVVIGISVAEVEAAKLVAEGEAEYMRIMAEAYSDTDKVEYYTFVRSLEAAKASLSGDNKTLIITKDSPIAQVFYGK